MKYGNKRGNPLLSKSMLKQYDVCKPDEYLYGRWCYCISSNLSREQKTKNKKNGNANVTV